MPSIRELVRKLSEEVNGQIFEDAGFYVEYADTNGNIQTMLLDAEDYESALYEAVGLLCE